MDWGSLVFYAIVFLPVWLTVLAVPYVLLVKPRRCRIAMANITVGLLSVSPGVRLPQVKAQLDAYARAHKSLHDYGLILPIPTFEESFASRVLAMLKARRRPATANFKVLVSDQKLAYRRNFVVLLFNLAAESGGITSQQWDYVVRVMQRLKLGQRDLDYMSDRFSRLRVEGDASSGAYRRQQGGQNDAGGKKKASAAALTPYLVALQLPQGFTRQQLQAQYRKMARLFHPDLPQNAHRQRECERQMAVINEAYSKLLASLG